MANKRERKIERKVIRQKTAREPGSSRLRHGDGAKSGPAHSRRKEGEGDSHTGRSGGNKHRRLNADQWV